MSTIVRKKRNFKGLGLDVSQPPLSPQPEPIPTRLAPAAGGAGGKRKPPPMVLKKAEAASSAGDGDNKLTVTVTPTSAPSSASRASHLQDQIGEMGQPKFDLRNEDLREIAELGQGNGGSVKLVEHTPTNTIMAKKIVLIDAKPSVRKQILRELQIMHNCQSDHIVSFYGAFVADPNICICMEAMDKGSLDGIYKKAGPIPIEIVGKIAMAVLEGLTYLYEVHHIIHRDIKPSNILFNSQGQIKICDFGVSGELINSIADTFVGTSTYMSPERIQGAQYTVKSDVWSMGISLIELALGRFPFAESESDDDLSDLEGTLSPSRPGGGLNFASAPTGSARPTSKKDKRKSKGVSLQGGGMTMSILELLQHIVNEPAPRLTEGRFSDMHNEFVDSCLRKDPEIRLAPSQLLKHPWMNQTREADIDLVAWAKTF